MQFQGKIDFRKPITLNSKPHGIEHISTLTTWASSDEGRVVHAEDTHKVWFGTDTEWVELTPGGVPDHNHDDRYYTETEIDNFFEGESAGKKQVDFARITNPPATYSPSVHGNAAHDATYITSTGVTYENLNSSGDVGSGADQVAVGNHNHTSLSVTGSSFTISTVTSGNIILSAVDEIQFTDSRISNIEFSDASNTTLPGGATSIIGAINAAYSAGGGANTLDEAYNGGSSIAVDDTNVTWTLSADKTFTIADGTDTAKFVVSTGTTDSISINTSGIIDFAADSIDIYYTSGSGLSIWDTGVGLYGGTTQDIILYTEGAKTITAETRKQFYVHATIGTDDNSIWLNSVAGGIDIDTANTKPITIDVGSFSVDGVLASNVSVTGANLTLSTITSGNVILISAAELQFTDSRISNIEFSDASNTTLPGGTTSILGAINAAYSAGGGYSSLDDAYNNGSSITVDTSPVIWTLSTGQSFVINDATDTYKFAITEGTGSTSILVNTTGGITMGGTSLAVGLSDSSAGLIIGSGIVGLSNTTGNITISSGSTGTTYITSETKVQINGGTAGELQLFALDGGTITVNTGSAGSMHITTGQFQLSASGSPSAISSSEANLTLSTITSGNVIITSAGIIDMNGDADLSGKFTVGHIVLPGSAPGSPVAGSAYFNAATKTLYIHDGSGWASVTLT